VSICYSATQGLADGITIPIDLILIGDEAVPEIKLAVQMEGVFVASLADLFQCKARAWVADRDKASVDMEDFTWICRRLGRRDMESDCMALLALVFPSSSSTEKRNITP